MFNINILDKYLNDVYDVEGYTTSEVLCKFHEKINEIIDEFNRIDENFINLDTNVNEKLTYLLNEGLTIEVSNKVIEMYKNGKLERLINEKLYNTMQDIDGSIFNEDLKVSVPNIANANDETKIPGIKIKM